MSKVIGFGEINTKYYLMQIRVGKADEDIWHKYNGEILSKEDKELTKGILLSNFRTSIKSCIDFLEKLLSESDIIGSIRTVKELRGLDTHTSTFPVMVPYCVPLPHNIVFKVELPFSIVEKYNYKEQRAYIEELLNTVKDISNFTDDEFLNKLGYRFVPEIDL